MTFGSMHAERLLQSIRIPNSVLIAQAVFLLERGHTDKQTDKQTDASERPIPAPAVMPAWANMIADTKPQTPVTSTH